MLKKVFAVGLSVQAAYPGASALKRQGGDCEGTWRSVMTFCMELVPLKAQRIRLSLLQARMHLSSRSASQSTLYWSRLYRSRAVFRV